MSPGGGVSVPAGAAPVADDAVDDEALVDDVACDDGVLAEPPLQALAQSPAAARTASRLVTVLAFLMARMLWACGLAPPLRQVK
jgi:hypothetical protein